MADSTDQAADKCPVDSETRLAWLKANPNASSFPGATKAAAAQTPSGDACDSSKIDQQVPSRKTPVQSGWFSGWLWSSAPEPAPSPPKALTDILTTERVISTIPRVLKTDRKDDDKPANNEIESGPSSSGNWIYPSEKMFFEAMSRKNHNPNAPDMKTIVPIHNAVNERAWAQIKSWERPYGAENQCGGPRLESFMGQSRNMTPKARIMTWVGYAAPFDRHDWIVDRCGKKVDYVIDFYSGKDEGKVGKSLNFYLDVRPKLNSFEGVKMRVFKFCGLV